MCQCGHFSLISSINAKIWRGRSDRRMNYVCSAVSFNWKWHFNKLVSRQCSLYGHYAYENEYEYEYLISSPIINANDDRSALRLVLIWSTAAHQHLNLAFSFLFLCFNFFPFFYIFFLYFSCQCDRVGSPIVWQKGVWMLQFNWVWRNLT